MGMRIFNILGTFALIVGGLAPAAARAECQKPQTNALSTEPSSLAGQVRVTVDALGDGENDRASALTHEGVFRVAMGISPETYVQRFGPRPAPPAKGGVVNTGHDFAALDVLTPHPVYAWMGWVRTTSPTASSYAEIRPLIEEAHRLAVAKFDGRQRRSARSAAT
jgi:hypothetical protein